MHCRTASREGSIVKHFVVKEVTGKVYADGEHTLSDAVDATPEEEKCDKTKVCAHVKKSKETISQPFLISTPVYFFNGTSELFFVLGMVVKN